MNDSKNSSKGLLVLRLPEVLTGEQIAKMFDLIKPLADSLGVEPVVLDGEVRTGYSPPALLERVCVALEEIAAQGRTPVVNVAEIAPQALNARPGYQLSEGEIVAGLNTRGGR